MYKILFAVFVLLNSVRAQLVTFTEAEYLQMFNEWQDAYGLSFNERATTDSFANFKANVDASANSQAGFESNLNAYSHMTFEEFGNQFLGVDPTNIGATGSSSGGLSTGAIAGIAVGGGLGAIAIVGGAIAAVVAVKKRRSKAKKDVTEHKDDPKLYPLSPIPARGIDTLSTPERERVTSITARAVPQIQKIGHVNHS